MKIRIGVLKESNTPIYDNCSLNGWHPREGCLFPGVDVEITRELFQKMNASHQFIVADTLTDIILMGMNGTIETAIYSITLNAKFINEQIFQYTNPVMFQPYVFIFKLVDDSFKAKLLSLIKPFSQIAWAYIIAICVLFLSLWLLIQKNKTKKNQFKFSRAFFDFFDIFQGIGNNEHFVHNYTSIKFFFLYFYFFGIIFSASYQNGLLISFKDGKRDISLTSLSDLIHLLENGHLKIVTFDDDWHFFWRIQASDGDFFKKLNKIFLKNNYTKVNSRLEVDEYLMTGDYVFPTSPFAIQSEYDKYRCKFSIVNINDEKQSLAYVYRKNSSVLPLINSAITSSWPMINTYIQKYKIDYPTESTCPEREGNVALKLKNIAGPNILLLVGLSISMFIFISEIIKPATQINLNHSNAFIVSKE